MVLGTNVIIICNRALFYNYISQGALEIEGELLCFVGALTDKYWLHITSGITSPVCHQPNTGKAEWNTDGTDIYSYILYHLDG